MEKRILLSTLGQKKHSLQADFSMKFNEKVAILRKLRAFTQQELADAISVPLRTLQQIEQGKVAVSIQTEQRLITALGIPREEFYRFDINLIFEGLKSDPEKEVERLKSRISVKYVEQLEKTIEALTYENMRLKLNLAKITSGVEEGNDIRSSSFI